MPYSSEPQPYIEGEVTVPHRPCLPSIECWLYLFPELAAKPWPTTTQDARTPIPPWRMGNNRRVEKKQGSRASSLSSKIGFAVSHTQLPPGISPKVPYLVLGFQDYQHTLKLYSLQLLAVFWARIIFPGSFLAVGQAAKGLTVSAGDVGLGQ